MRRHPAAPALAVFARAPVVGAVKTRLAAAIGEAAALTVYRALLARTAQVVRDWPGPVTLFAAGAIPAFADGPCAGLAAVAQVSGGLGARLAAAFTRLLADGPALIIGTDCWALTTHHLHALASAVHQAPAAFGPAEDGGYWGIALADPAMVAVCCADDLPWSQAGLLTETCRRLRAIGVEPAFAPGLPDLDDAAGLAAAEAAGFTWRQAGG